MEVNPLLHRFQCEATEDPEGFWALAAEKIPWFRKWDRVFEWEPPGFRWFIGGQTNISYNCLDNHVNRGWGEHPALIAENERCNRRVYTYAQLLAEVKQAAAALRGMGIRRGDRVAIYMPTCVEALVLMLAVTRIGAIHLVVFAGFGSSALADRMQKWLLARRFQGGHILALRPRPRVCYCSLRALVSVAWTAYVTEANRCSLKSSRCVSSR